MNALQVCELGVWGFIRVY
ncbi:hypothetical protein OCT59_025561 [Rhizophagus irregularis]|nr:hypothetical protein OCT59_025561 [Rhizophagus irregularis]